jgi:hypothetical protein
MPSIATWKQLNAVSALAFGSFVVLALGCHVLTQPLGEGQRESAPCPDDLPNPAFEILLAALMVIMASNAVLYVDRQDTQGCCLQ